MKIVICGSMTFAGRMLNTKNTLEKMGHEVILPIDTIETVKDPSLRENVNHCIDKEIIKDHLNKIKQSDAILVLNYEKNGIEGYIGGSVLIEMGFAHYFDKKIFLVNSIPKMSYTVELTAMRPTVLNENIEKSIIQTVHLQTNSD